MTEAADLFDVARCVRRLGRNPMQSPHALLATSAGLADRIESIARDIGAKPRRPAGRNEIETMKIAGRRVLVQRRRAAFGIR